MAEAKKKALSKAGAKPKTKSTRKGGAKKPITASVKLTSDKDIYVVKEGDTLYSIAQKMLKKGSRYSEIKTLNKLKNDIIVAGQLLKLPKF